jgi:hypothetical protein
VISISAIPSPEETIMETDCFKNNQKQLTDQCYEPFKTILKANNAEKVMEKYREDKNVDNIPDDFKKNVCCPIWKLGDCQNDVVKNSAGCVETLTKKLQEGMVKHGGDKICGEKYSKSGCQSLAK